MFLSSDLFVYSPLQASRCPTSEVDVVYLYVPFSAYIPLFFDLFVRMFVNYSIILFISLLF